MVLVNVGVWVRLELRLRLVLGVHLVSAKVRKFEGSRVRRFFIPKEIKGSAVRTKRFCM